MSDAPAPTRGARLLGALALLPALGLVAFALGGPVLSGDLWWHVRAGEWMLDHRALPDSDPFSHTAGGRHWILQEYLSQVLLALTVRAAGIAGLKALGVALGVAVLLAVYRYARRLAPPALAAALAALFALLYALKWELRPHLVSTLFFLAFARILFPRDASRVPGRREALLVLLLSCAWVQLHAEALFAPILASAGLIGAALGGGARRVGAWSLVLAAAVAGTLLSPLGWEPHAYALLHRSVPQQFIEEWFRPWVSPSDPRFVVITQPVFWAFWACAFAGGLHLLALGWRKLRGRAPEVAWERLGFLAVCLVMSLQARRFLWLAWFPVADLAAAHLATRGRAALVRPAAVVAAAALALVLLGTHYVSLALGAWRQGLYTRDVEPQLFPVAAAELVREAGLAGNLFHPYEWGGYLGFALGTANPVYIDGRTVLFEDVIEERWRAERDPALLARLLEERDVQVIVFDKLVDHGAGTTAWSPPPGWRLVWSDALARVWVRADADLAGLRRHLDGLGIPFDGRFVEAAALGAGWDWALERRVFPANLVDALRAAEGAAARAAVFDAHGMRRNAEFERGRESG